MKHAKKLFAFLLAAIMVLAMGTTAFAADTYSLTISGTTTGHTYSVYQIFSGVVYDDDGTLILSDIQWGTGVDGSSLLEALQEDDTIGELFEDCETAADVAKALENASAAELDAFAAVVVDNLATATKTDVASAAGSTKITGLEAGYYIVVETTGSVPKGETYTKYIVQVVGDTSIKVKSGTVEFDKNVIDTNDSAADSTSGWQETADHDIGDTISYRLTGTLPENYADYEGYYYKFTDTLTKGLTLDSDSIYVTVEINGTEYKLSSDDYTVTVGTADTNGNVTFTVTINDLKKVTTDIDENEITIDADTVVYVYYTCTLNEDAVIGSKGNPNTAYLEYSDNPNTAEGGSTDSTGTTPEDTNIVFTYALVVNKTDEDGDALPGAGFTLYKWDAEKEDWVAVGSEVTGDQMTTFNFEGLDDGKYMLVETTTPDGYNTMDDIYIEITAVHGETTESLTSLTATFYSDKGFSVPLAINGTSNSVTGVVSTGTVTASVVNESGSTLPTTGGMGTTVLYVIGIILVAGAGILLVVRRRMSA